MSTIATRVLAPIVPSDGAQPAARVAHAATRLPPNLFGIPLGLAGLGDAWWVAEKL